MVPEKTGSQTDGQTDGQSDNIRRFFLSEEKNAKNQGVVERKAIVFICEPSRQAQPGALV